MKKKNDQITRKEALKKFSKYTALTAIGTFVILNPQMAQATSPPPEDPRDTGPVRDPNNGRGIWGNDKPDSNDKYDSEDSGSIWK
jgi:hypothetical protein